MNMREIVVDADVFISYLSGDVFAERAETLIDQALAKEVSLQVSSELYDDIISAYRSNGYALKEVLSILADLRAIPYTQLPLTLEMAIKAMEIYEQHKGSRKLHYFDSFHIATAFYTYHKTIVTTDKYILDNANEFGIKTIDLRSIR